MENKKISNNKKREIYGGSSTKISSSNWWNNSIGFGIVGSTIVSIVQLIFNIVNSFLDINDTKKSKYYPSYSQSNIKYRISKYPSKANVFI